MSFFCLHHVFYAKGLYLCSDPLWPQCIAFHFSYQNNDPFTYSASCERKSRHLILTHLHLISSVLCHPSHSPSPWSCTLIHKKNYQPTFLHMSKVKKPKQYISKQGIHIILHFIYKNSFHISYHFTFHLHLFHEKINKYIIC